MNIADVVVGLYCPNEVGLKRVSIFEGSVGVDLRMKFDFDVGP